MDVRAGDVHFQKPDLFFSVEERAGAGVFLHGKAADVGDHFLVKHPLEPWQFFADDGANAGVLQAHGVEHAGGRVGDARGGVAKARFLRGALEGEGAEYVDVVPLGKLVAIAERSAGGDDGVVQRPAGERYLCVHASTSPFLNTGPSLQTRLAPLFVWQVQPTQAPKPQPMRSS